MIWSWGGHLLDDTANKNPVVLKLTPPGKMQDNLGSTNVYFIAANSLNRV